jgi:hypothetical protein
MSELSNQSLCVLSMIFVVAMVPKYVQIPDSLLLLFKDTIGQLLLLGLAIAVGSYNFTCGLLLAVLFLSLMIKLNMYGNKTTEGFVNYKEGEDSDMKLGESFEDMEDSTEKKKTEKSTDTKSTKTTKTPKTTKTVENNDLKELDMNQLKTELKSSQQLIKSLEDQLAEYQINGATSQPSSDDKAMKVIEKEYSEKTKMKENNEASSEEESTIEPFQCGCDSDDARLTLIRYQKANMDDSIETFTSKQEPIDPFDVSGCKYDMGFKPYNDTLYGPPVSSCSAYKNVNLGATGTVFYPLN